MQPINKNRKKGSSKQHLNIPREATEKPFTNQEPSTHYYTFLVFLQANGKKYNIEAKFHKHIMFKLKFQFCKSSKNITHVIVIAYKAQA